MSPRQPDEEAIFEMARKIDDLDARAACLELLCGDNTALLERVRALLQLHQKADSLDSSPSGVDATVDQPLTVRPGTVIGKYKLMEQIGEGGMGVVYVAEQARPMRRRVALKVIKPGMDSKEVISRFAAERQALALMDHPNIAKVHDAGTTDSGRPYFVMELVRGVPVTEYCDLNKFSARQRLELFVHVCHAVQHAHQKGVIHRDLKPSNVLITEHDGTPVVKVIDFGVAKAINQQLTERTIYTRHQQMVGTPIYMSPEQAELSGLDVDTRSDIYSLGVLLYELLTGTTPFDRQRLNEAAHDEIRRIIREEEPSKPSTKVRTIGNNAETISGYRNTHPAKLSQLLRGDLDWIVMKSLEKDRNRRYDTAKGLANDIERHLSDEPIVARPPSVAYQFQKFARRHKALLTSAAFVSLALIVGTGVATWMAVVAGRARNKAQSNLVRALGAEATQRKLADEARLLAEREAAARETAQRLAESEATARQQTRRQLYVSDMRVALQEWSDGNIDRVISLLRRHQPEHAQDDLRGFEWYHLWESCRRAFETLVLKHDAPVVAVAFSPRQKRIAVGGGKWVTVWSLESHQKERVFEGAQEWVHDVTFSPDGSKLAVANYDRNVQLWDVESGDQEFTLHHKEIVWSVEFSPDGELLASGSGHNHVILWDAKTGMETDTLVRYSNGAYFWGSLLAFSSDGRFLAAGTRAKENSIAVWNMQSKELAGTLSAGDVRAIDFSTDDKIIAVKTTDNQVVLWDWMSGQDPKQISIEGPPVAGTVVFSPGSSVFAVTGPAHTIELRDGATGEKLDTFAGHSDLVAAAAFSPTGEHLASGSSDGTVRLWDITSTSGPSVIQAHSYYVQSLEFSPDGNLLVSGGADEVKLWDTHTWRLHKIVDDQASRYSVTFSPNGNLLGYSTSAGENRVVVRLWDVREHRVRDSLSLEADYTHSMAFAPDSRYLAIAVGNDIKIWDVSGQEELKTLKGHTSLVSPIVFSPDGNTLVSTSTDNTVKLWDVATGSLLGDLVGNTQAVGTFIFSPDGTLISGGNRTLRLWNLTTRQEAGVLAENLSIRRFALSCDNTTLAIASDRFVTLWDLDKQEERIKFRCQDEVYSVAFSPNGNTLVGGLKDGTIKICRAADPEEVRRAGW